MTTQTTLAAPEVGQVWVPGVPHSKERIVVKLGRAPCAAPDSQTFADCIFYNYVIGGQLTYVTRKKWNKWVKTKKAVCVGSLQESCAA